MKKRCLSWILAAIMLFAGCTVSNQNIPSPKDNIASMESDTNKLLSVHYIDVGQGDSELIQLPNGQNMLIDSGTNESGDDLLSYLDAQNVKKIDYLIATHPHADHIGSMDDVVDKYEIGEIYMPRATTNSKTYERLLTAIDKKGLKIHTAKAKDVLFDKDNISAVILAPNSASYEDLNNYSVVIKLVYGDNSFLFTGDAEDISENEMLNAKANIRANVLKVGHHGSHSSTTPKFLDAVNPDIAVISCGVDNSYGHPHKETLSALNARHITVYRTDEDGSIILTSDGKNIQKQ